MKVPDEIEEIWKKNLSMKEGNAQLWEEDRLLPVMQIGELVWKRRDCTSCGKISVWWIIYRNAV